MTFAGDSPPAHSGSQTGSQRGSQRRQTPSDARRRPATIAQVRCLIRRHPATARDGQNSPEKRKVGSSTLPLTTICQPRWQPAPSAFSLFSRCFRLYFSRSAGVCGGMPSCPWGARGGGPERRLVGFLWGPQGLRRLMRPTDQGLRAAAWGAGSGLGPSSWQPWLAGLPDSADLRWGCPALLLGRCLPGRGASRGRPGRRLAAVSGVGHDAVVGAAGAGAAGAGAVAAEHLG